MVVLAEDISKSSLRKQALLLRRKIVDKEYLEIKITENILKNQVVKKSKNILVYISKDFEVSTFSLIEKLWDLKKEVYAPKVVGNQLEFYRINSFQDLSIGKYNIFEPTSNWKFQDYESSCIIVPGLLFDREGNRLGYGGGYYDRYLKNRNIYKIGICFSNFLTDKLISFEHDIKMDEIITER